MIQFNMSWSNIQSNKRTRLICSTFVDTCAPIFAIVF